MQEWLIWAGIAAVAIVYIAFIWGRNFWGIVNRTTQTVLALSVWWMALNAYADTQNREPVMKDWLPYVVRVLLPSGRGGSQKKIPHVGDPMIVEKHI